MKGVFFKFPCSCRTTVGYISYFCENQYAMKKSEIFDTIQRKVVEICEVNFQEFTSGVKGHDVVDARILCVQFLWRVGFSNEEIALFVLSSNRGMTGLTTSSPEVKSKAKHINKLLNSYNQRCKDAFTFRRLASKLNEFVVEFMRANDVPTSHDESTP